MNPSEELNKGYEFTKAQIAELTRLRAFKAEIEKQEPVAWEWVTPEKGVQISHTEPAEYEEVYHLKPLFSAPVVSPDVEKLKAEIVSLRQQICASQSNVMARDEYIQSLTTELVAALKDAEWQPIETAPKGERFLTTTKLSNGSFGQVGISHSFFCYEVNTRDWKIAGDDPCATHWMPLPTPPKRSMEGV